HDLLHLDAFGLPEQVQDGAEALVTGHRFGPAGRIPAIRSMTARASAAIAVRPAPRYLRESTRSASASRRSRTARVKARTNWVETLILRIPAAMAPVIVASGTPEDPCRTSGTGTAAARAATRSISTLAVLVVIAWE